MAFSKLRQKDQKFQANLGYTVKPCFKKPKQNLTEPAMWKADEKRPVKRPCRCQQKGETLVMPDSAQKWGCGTAVTAGQPEGPFLQEAPFPSHLSWVTELSSSESRPRTQGSQLPSHCCSL